MQIWADMTSTRRRPPRMMVRPDGGDLRAQEFIDGRGAFFINSTAGLGRFIRDVKDFEIGTAFMPHTEGNNHAVPDRRRRRRDPGQGPPGEAAGRLRLRQVVDQHRAGRLLEPEHRLLPDPEVLGRAADAAGLLPRPARVQDHIDQLQYAREAPLTPHWPAIAKESHQGDGGSAGEQRPGPAGARQGAGARPGDRERLTRGWRGVSGRGEDRDHPDSWPSRDPHPRVP